MSDATPVEAPDKSKKTSVIMGPTSNEATVQMSQASQKCYWNDVEFSADD